jgi:MFS transporter, DHA2 family, multidrug resistance protein
MSDLQLQASDRRRWWALGALSLSVLVVALDLFVLTLALPTISADLHASSSDLQWFIDAYSLVLAAALLPAGLLGDRFGRKRLLTGALVLFGIASLACAYATSTGELIAARAVLGLAAAVIMPLSLAVIPVMFTEAERPKAIAAVGGATFLGYPIGPILGGWLLDHFWWGSVFLINVPVVVIALIAVTRLMPESRGARQRRIDLAGVLLSALGLTVLTYGFIKAGQNGWSDRTAIITMLVGVVALIGFVAWERTTERRPGGQPLVELSLFRSAGFSWGTVLSTMVTFALFGITYAMPQYYLDVRGLDSLASGIRLLPLIGGLIVGLGLGQRLQTPGKGGQPVASVKFVASAGFAIMAVALAVGSGTSPASGTGYLVSWFALTGFGLGLAMPTALNAALGALSAERSGSGSALMTAMRQVGGTIGVAVLGTVLATVYRSHLVVAGLPAQTASQARSSVAAGAAIARQAHSAALGGSVHAAYSAGVDAMLWVCAGIAIAAAVLAALFMPQRAGSGTAAGLERSDVTSAGVARRVADQVRGE